MAAITSDGGRMGKFMVMERLRMSIVEFMKENFVMGKKADMVYLSIPMEGHIKATMLTTRSAATEFTHCKLTSYRCCIL